MAKKINMAEISQQAISLNQPKKFFAIQQSIACSVTDSKQQAYWLWIIRDLIEGAGYNYSRIAKRVHACPSTIQKLVTHPGRKPRPHLFENLLILYDHIFNGPYPTQRVQEYLRRRPVDVLKQLPQSWLNNLLANHRL